FALHNEPYINFKLLGGDFHKSQFYPLRIIKNFLKEIKFNIFRNRFLVPYNDIVVRTSKSTRTILDVITLFSLNVFKVVTRNDKHKNKLIFLCSTSICHADKGSIYSEQMLSF